MRFAMPREVNLTTDMDGLWEHLDNGDSVWRLRVFAPAALSLNLGFSRYHLPPYSRLLIYAEKDSGDRSHYTEGDNAPHNQLWTPVLIADEIVVELTTPTATLDRVELELQSVNVGYRLFGEKAGEKKPLLCSSVPLPPCLSLSPRGGAKSSRLTR